MTLDSVVVSTDQPDADQPDADQPDAGRPSPVARARRLLSGPVAGLVLGAVVLQAVVTLLFAWPGPGSSMHGLPIAVAGPRDVAELAARSLEASPKGAMSATLLPDEGAARTAVLNRTVYGAVVIEADGLKLLIASGASPEVADRLTRALELVQARGQGTYLDIENLAPNPRKDPDGVAPGRAVLALLITSVLVGAVIHRRLPSTRGRLAAVFASAAVTGPAVALVLHVVLEALPGSLWGEAGVLALFALAVTATTVAFGVVAELAGIGLAATLIVAVGYPVSGATSAPELVPAPWDVVGGYLPGGAGNTALRGVAFFDGAAVTMPVLVLLGWALVGVVIVSVPGSAWTSRLRPPFKRAWSGRTSA